MDYIMTNSDGRVCAWTFNAKYATGFEEVEIPEGFDVNRMQDWLYQDGEWTHDPLPEPEPQPTPMEELTERVDAVEDTANVALSTAEAASASANPQIMTFATMALASMAPTMTDDQAVEVSTLWPKWSAESVAYAVDQIVRWNSHLWRCVQAHTSQESWTPDAAPSLWSRIDISGDGVEVWTQPTGAHNAYNVGDRVHYPTADGPIYVSTIAGNVWSPDAYPQGWQLEEVA